MIALDTDHLTVFANADDSRYSVLSGRVAQAIDEDFAVPIVAAEEQLRGWLAQIHRFTKPKQQIFGYDQLRKLLVFLCHFTILPLDNSFADHFDRLRKQKVRIGSMDLKIAAIALAHDALLLTANTRDFGQVPGLRFANWLDEASPGG